VTYLMLTRQRIDHRCLTRSPLPVPVAKAQSVEKYEGGKKVNRRRARCRHGPKPAAVASHASGSASLARPIACGRLRRARARAAQPAADGRRGTGGNAATWGVEGQKQSQAGGAHGRLRLTRAALLHRRPRTDMWSQLSAAHEWTVRGMRPATGGPRPILLAQGAGRGDVHFVSTYSTRESSY
jgi:hypothetical protein